MTSLKENLTLWLFGSDNLMMVEQQRPYVQCKIALTSFRCYIIDKITITIRMCNVICAGAIFREKKTVCVHCLRLVCVRVFLALPSLFSWRIRNVTIFFFFFFFFVIFFRYQSFVSPFILVLSIRVIFGRILIAHVVIWEMVDISYLTFAINLILNLTGSKQGHPTRI